MNSVPRKILAILSVLIAVSVYLAIDTDASNEKITVTDGHGVTNVFDVPAEHVAAYGIGTNEILIRVGALEKIVVCDKYVVTSAEECMKPLQQRISEGKTLARGGFWSSEDIELFKDDILLMEHKGNFDCENDVVFLFGTASSYENMKSVLSNAGCKHIVAWDDVTSYEDIIDAAKAVSLISTGSVHECIEDMEEKYGSILTELPGMAERPNAFYVTFSSDNFRVGNIGSKATAVLEAAGAKIITKNPSKESTYYTNIAQLVSDYDYDVIVFADETSIAKNPERLQQLRAYVSDDVQIYCMKSLWNNYSVSSIDGVWSSACLFYPDIFSGDGPAPLEAEREEILPFVIAGILGSLAVVGISVYFMRD